MELVEDLGFAPNDEVDEVRWLAPDEALELLSYERDRQLVRAAGSETARLVGTRDQPVSRGSGSSGSSRCR